jgi:hypothetical protein
MNDRDYMNRLEAGLSRGMASVQLPAVEPANARYRIEASKVGRRAMSRLTIAFAAVGLALFTGLVGSAAAGTGPAILLSTTMHDVVVVVEQVITGGEPAPANPTGEAGGPPAGSASGHESVAAPESSERAAEPAEPAEPAETPPREPIAATAPRDLPPEPIEEPKSVVAPTEGPPPAD